MNPMLIETWRGLGGHGTAQRTWLVCLACLSVVLLLWWPQRDVLFALAAQRGPNTALALVIGLGIASAWYALAAGAEEVLLPGQQALREWRLDSALGTARIVRGLVFAHLLLMLHAFALAAPLLLAAAVVSPASTRALGWCLLGAALQSLWFRLVGASMKLAIGHHAQWFPGALRALFVAALVLPPFFVPYASHVMVSHTLLRDGSSAAAGVAGLSVVLSHLLIGLLLTLLSCAVLHWQLHRLGRAASQ